MKSYCGCTFVGDWFRINPTKSQVTILQNANVEWVSRLLSRAVGQCLHLRSIVMPSYSSEMFAVQLGNPELLKMYGSAAEAAWASVYDTLDSHYYFERLYDAIPDQNLVVGFEIPPTMKYELNSRGFDYISLHLHPMRIMSDLMLGALTNSPALAEALQNIEFEKDQIARRASWISACYAQLDPVQSKIPEGIPILFGQTRFDSSLICNGHFTEWQEHAEELSSLLDGADEVVFARHPGAPWRFDVLEFLRDALNKTVIGISGNSYTLIGSAQKLGPLITLSSSIGVEAGAFGREVNFLLADPRSKFAVPGLDNPEQIPLDHRIFAREFWEGVFSGSEARWTELEQRGFYLGENFLRGTLGSAPIAGRDGMAPFLPMEKLIVPKVGDDPARLDAIAGVLAGATSGDRDGAVVAAALNNIDIKLSPAPLSVGTSWNWNPRIAMPSWPLIAGFHQVENRGVWLSGQKCVFEIPVQSEDDLILECEAELTFFEGIATQHPAVIFRVDEIPIVGVIQLTEQDRRHRVAWSMRTTAARKKCILEIECTHAASPHDMNINEDERRLSVCLHHLNIFAKPVLGPRERSGLRLIGLGVQPIDIAL